MICTFFAFFPSCQDSYLILGEGGESHSSLLVLARLLNLILPENRVITYKIEITMDVCIPWTESQGRLKQNRKHSEGGLVHSARFDHECDQRERSLLGHAEREPGTYFIATESFSISFITLTSA